MYLHILLKMLENHRNSGAGPTGAEGAVAPRALSQRGQRGQLVPFSFSIISIHDRRVVSEMPEIAILRIINMPKINLFMG